MAVSVCGCPNLMTRVLMQRVSPEVRTNGDLIHFVHDADIDARTKTLPHLHSSRLGVFVRASAVEFVIVTPDRRSGG